MEYTLEFLEGLEEGELEKIRDALSLDSKNGVFEVFLALVNLGVARPIEDEILKLYSKNDEELADLLSLKGFERERIGEMTKLEACQLLCSTRKMQKQVSLDDLRVLLNLSWIGVRVPKLTNYSDGIATFEVPELFPLEEVDEETRTSQIETLRETLFERGLGFDDEFDDFSFDKDGNVWVTDNWQKICEERRLVPTQKLESDDSSCEIIDY
jgi:hypothetical protein